MAVTEAVNTALCFVVIDPLIHAAVIISIKKVQPLFTTVTQVPSPNIDTDISALHPPALIITVVRHIIPVIPDVAIRVITVSTSYPRGDNKEEAEKQDPRGHFTQ